MHINIMLITHHNHCQPLAILLKLLLLLVVPTLQQQSMGANLNPTQDQLSLMSTQQYHFVPPGSFFQYSLASWTQDDDPKYIDKVQIQYNIQVISQSPHYNFIVLFSDSNSSSSYEQFNCYVRAVNEGLAQLMQNCNFPINTTSSGVCNQSIQVAAEDLFATTYTFFNCQDSFINYTIKSKDSIGPINGTLLFIIDNSGLFPSANSTSTTTALIQLILTNSAVANVNEQQKAKLYLFSGLTGILILIMMIIAVVLNCKIRRLDKQLLSQRIKGQ